MDKDTEKVCGSEGQKKDPKQLREEFVGSEGGNRELREYLWDELGDEGVKLLEPGFLDSAVVGLVVAGTSEYRAVYDFELLCLAYAEDYLKYAKDHPELHAGEEYGFDEAYMEAVEWVEYNTLRSIPYEGPMAPIVINRCPGLELPLERSKTDD